MDKTIVTALGIVLASCTFASVAAADPQTPQNPDVALPQNVAGTPMKLSVFTSAGYLGTSGGSGAALATGIRAMIGNHFALGLDLGYGIMALQHTMQDRWWMIPSMAVVIPARIGSVPLSFDIGAGLGLGTSSGYASWSTYSARPFSADWAFQLVPAVRAHVIAAASVSKSVDVFVRADAAAMVLPQNAAPSDADGTWMMFAIGTRFRLL